MDESRQYLYDRLNEEAALRAMAENTRGLALGAQAAASPFTPANTTLIVDVSKWVPVADLALLKAAGVRGIIARIGEGINVNEDPTWAYYVNEAAKVGIPCHGYYVIHPELYDNYDQNIKVQLSRIVQFCQNKTFAGLWIDAEIFKDADGKLIAPVWISERTRGMLDETARALGYRVPVGLYTGGWYVDSYCPQMKTWMYKYPLWWAWYTVTASAEIEWSALKDYYPAITPTNLPPDATGQKAATMSLWQWTGDRLKLPGMWSRTDRSVRAAADLNFFMGDENAWYEFSQFTPPAQPPDNPPPDQDDDQEHNDNSDLVAEIKKTNELLSDILAEMKRPKTIQ